MSALDEARRSIDRIDRQIADLFTERMAAASTRLGIAMTTSTAPLNTMSNARLTALYARRERSQSMMDCMAL